jgi:hypothetical protein
MKTANIQHTEQTIKIVIWLADAVIAWTSITAHSAPWKRILLTVLCVRKASFSTSVSIPENVTTAFFA